MNAKRAWQEMLAVDQIMFAAQRSPTASQLLVDDARADSDKAHATFSEELRVYDV